MRPRVLQKAVLGICLASCAPLAAQERNDYFTDDPPSPAVADDDDAESSYTAIQDPRTPTPSLAPPSGARQQLPGGTLGLSNQGISLLGNDPFQQRIGAKLSTSGRRSDYLSTDLGDLLKKVQEPSGVQVQRRNPIVHEPRPRAIQSQQANVGGSYWFPARQDLDTAVSKLDSQLIEEVTVIRGPYSVRHGPGFSFVDFELVRTPRYEYAHAHGDTTLDYRTNGQQWHGRQEMHYGAANWGATVGYTHRTGNDYETGDNFEIPSSFNSREVNFGLGYDLSPDSTLELSVLRLDQTNLELPGQAYDIEFLVTDAFEATWELHDQEVVDSLFVEGWYNRTRFNGNAQRPGKRRQNPAFDDFRFQGVTNVDGASMGYAAMAGWGDEEIGMFTIGSDLRVLKQNVEETTTFDIISPLLQPYNPMRTVDKQVPKSDVINPGLLADLTLPCSDCITLHTGARVDLWSTNVVSRNPIQEANILGLLIVPPGIPVVPVAFQDVIIPADALPDRDIGLYSVFGQVESRPTDEWTMTVGAGRAERAPTLTELYAINGPFLGVLQRGGNFVFGDSRLDKEKLWQLDIGAKADYGALRFGATGFHAWIQDYITYRPIIPISDLPTAAVSLPVNVNDPRQIPFQAVQYTNTDLATLVGGDAFVEADLTSYTTAFGTVAYVEGTDHRRSESGDPFFDIIDLRNFPPAVVIPATSPNKEPLPGIAPLEARVGMRLHNPELERRWEVEASVRIVDHQDRISRTLLEQETPGFTVVDLRGYWRPTERVMLVGGVENLGDRFYREHLDLRTGMFQPGISFYAGSHISY